MNAKGHGITFAAGCLLLVSALAVFLSGCALTVDKVKLDYVPQTGVQKFVLKEPVRVDVGVVDIRSKKDRVSSKKNGYGMEMAAIVAENDVADVVANAIVAELRSRGFEIGQGHVIVNAELQKFYNDFKLGFFSGDAEAEVVINTKVQGVDKTVRFAKVVAGEGKEPNIQLSSGENAKLALDRALADAIARLFSDPAFVDALITAEWARRRPEVTPPVTVAPTPPRSSHTMVVGMWSGTLHGQQGSYPLTVTFRDDGTYHATSATLNAGSFDGTWQLSGGNVVWEAVTTGRTGTATVQEAGGKPTLRMVPDDRTYTVELTPTVPFDLRMWLPGNWSGSGGGYELTISSNLTWQYTSTVNGRWFASGSAHINDPGTVVLEGWFRGSPSYGPAERLTMILHRYGESLTGEFRLSRTWHVTFSRAGRPATK